MFSKYKKNIIAVLIGLHILFTFLSLHNRLAFKSAISPIYTKYNSLTAGGSYWLFFASGTNLRWDIYFDGRRPEKLYREKSFLPTKSIKTKEFISYSVFNSIFTEGVSSRKLEWFCQSFHDLEIITTKLTPTSEKFLQIMELKFPFIYRRHLLDHIANNHELSYRCKNAR